MHLKKIAHLKKCMFFLNACFIFRVEIIKSHVTVGFLFLIKGVKLVLKLKFNLPFSPNIF
jgi:hypothetical protein